MSIDSTQIIPCTGWYYVTEDASNVYATPVAAWTLLANGDVVGLIPSQQNVANDEPPYPRLVTVPGKGKYVQEGLLPSGAKIV